MKLKNMNMMKLPYVYKKYNNLHGSYAKENSNLFIIIRLSDLRVLKIVAQALVLAFLITVLPGVIGANNNIRELSLPSNNEELNNFKLLPLVIQDLTNKGLLIAKDTSLIVSNGDKEHAMKTLDDMKILNNKKLIISPSDIERQSNVPDEFFDISFTNSFGSDVRGFIDRTLKVGGIVIVQLSQDPSLVFDMPSNYKMVYFRGYNSASFIAMQKMANSNYSSTPSRSRSQTQRKLFEFLSEEKKDVLKNLEDVLLEPPRSATGKSRTYLRKTKFLPDLLNDSLDGYSRRVYIDVGGGHGSTRWFEQNYPTRNKDFDIYRIETVPETEVELTLDDAWEGPPTQMGISDWLWRNVKAEEYVVMKADAEVVEEMLKSKAIVLVDELFLECKPLGKGGRSKRAYWECLALYGRLRDFGVAVHQWWG